MKTLISGILISLTFVLMAVVTGAMYLSQDNNQNVEAQDDVALPIGGGHYCVLLDVTTSGKRGGLNIVHITGELQENYSLVIIVSHKSGQEIVRFPDHENIEHHGRIYLPGRLPSGEYNAYLLTDEGGSPSYICTQSFSFDSGGLFVQEPPNNMSIIVTPESDGIILQQGGGNFNRPILSIDPFTITDSSVTINVENPNDRTLNISCWRRALNPSGTIGWRITTNLQSPPQVSANGDTNVVISGLTKGTFYAFRCNLRSTGLPGRISLVGNTVFATIGRPPTPIPPTPTRIPIPAKPAPFIQPISVPTNIRDTSIVRFYGGWPSVTNASYYRYSYEYNVCPNNRGCRNSMRGPYRTSNNRGNNFSIIADELAWRGGDVILEVAVQACNSQDRCSGFGITTTTWSWTIASAPSNTPTPIAPTQAPIDKSRPTETPVPTNPPTVPTDTPVPPVVPTHTTTPPTQTPRPTREVECPHNIQHMGNQLEDCECPPGYNAEQRYSSARGFYLECTDDVPDPPIHEGCNFSVKLEWVEYARAFRVSWTAARPPWGLRLRLQRRNDGFPITYFPSITGPGYYIGEPHTEVLINPYALVSDPFGVRSGYVGPNFLKAGWRAIIYDNDDHCPTVESNVFIDRTSDIIVTAHLPKEVSISRGSSFTYWSAFRNQGVVQGSKGFRVWRDVGGLTTNNWVSLWTRTITLGPAESVIITSTDTPPYNASQGTPNFVGYWLCPSNFDRDDLDNRVANRVCDRFFIQVHDTGRPIGTTPTNPAPEAESTPDIPTPTIFRTPTPTPTHTPTPTPTLRPTNTPVLIPPVGPPPVTGKCDFIIVEESISRTSATPRQPVTIRAKVRNQGDADCAASTLGWYRSGNSTITINDTRIATDSVRSLSAGTTSIEASYSFTAPATTGTYYYGACADYNSSVSESDEGNNCSTALTLTVATVETPCSGEISGPTQVVVGSSITLTWGHTSGQGTPSTYRWSESSTDISFDGSTTGSTITVDGDVVTSSAVVRITVTCTNGGIASDSYTIAVVSEVVENPCEGSISGPTTVAVGRTITLEWKHTSGKGTPRIYIWATTNEDGSLPADHISISGDSRSRTVVISGDSVGGGQVAIGVACTNGTVVVLTYDITVTALPIPKCDPTISGPTTVLTGASITLTWSSIQGGSPSTYAWTRSNTNVLISGTTLSRLTVTGSSAGTVTITLSVTCTNGATGSDTHDVTVSAPATPCAGSISGPTAVRVGSSIRLSWSHTSGQGVISSYSWSESSSSISISGSTTGSRVTINGVSSGTGTVSISVTCTNGGTTSDTHRILVSSDPCTVNIIWYEALPIYEGAFPSFYLDSENPDNNWDDSSINWTLPSGMTSYGGGDGLSYIDTEITRSGTFTVRVYVECEDGNSARDSFTFTASAYLCTGSISGPTILSQGSVGSYTFTLSTGATISTTTWTVPTGLSIANRSNNPASITGDTLGTYTISVSARCTNGNRGTATYKISVVLPCEGAIDGPPVINLGRLEHTLKWTHIDGTPDTYTWTLTGSLSGSSSTDSIDLEATLPFVDGARASITVICTNGGTKTDSVTFNVPCRAEVVGPLEVFPGSTVTYTERNLFGKNNYWVWSGTGGLTIQDRFGHLRQTITVSVPDDFITGIIRVAVSEAERGSLTQPVCATDQITVIVAPRPDLVVESMAASPVKVNIGNNINLSAIVRNQGGGTSGESILRWYFSTDAPIPSGDTEIETDSVPSLAANGISPQAHITVAPLTAGIYYYGACVDPVPNESDTTNNCTHVSAVSTGTPVEVLNLVCEVVEHPSITIRTQRNINTVTITWTASEDTDSYHMWALLNPPKDITLEAMNKNPDQIPDAMKYFHSREPMTVTVNDPQTLYRFEDRISRNDNRPFTKWVLFIRRNCTNNPNPSDWKREQDSVISRQGR